MSRWTVILVLFAFFVQFTPLRACDLEKAAVGSNCHERPEGACSDRPDRTPSDHRAATDDGECICDAAKPSAMRASGSELHEALPIDGWFADVIAMLAAPSTAGDRPSPAIPEPPGLPSEAYHFPLRF